MSDTGEQATTYLADAVFMDGFGDPEVLVHVGDVEGDVVARLPLEDDAEPGVVLAAAGWEVIGEWQPTLTGGTAPVRRRDGGRP